jgi:hypothetical protein
MKTIHLLALAAVINCAYVSAQDITSVYTLQAIKNPEYKPKTEKKKRMSLRKAIKEHLVRFKMKTNGNNEFTLNLTNQSATALELQIESGQVFKPSDADSSAYQNVIIPTEVQFVLGPFDSDVINLKGFCCNASRGCAKNGKSFEFSEMAKGELLNLCHFVNSHHNINLGDLNSGFQQAVHCLTDNKNISTIETNPVLKGYIAMLQNKAEPHCFYFNTTHMLYSQLNYKIDRNSHIKVVVKNKLGEVLYENSNPVEVKKGRYVYKLEMSLKNWDNGQYSICIVSDSGVIAQRKFTI